MGSFPAVASLTPSLSQKEDRSGSANSDSPPSVDAETRLTITCRSPVLRVKGGVRVMGRFVRGDLQLPSGRATVATKVRRAAFS